MAVRNRPRTGAAIGVAVGGVLAGHWLTYLVVAPATVARAALLRESGHGYLGVADRAGLAIALAALAGLFLHRLTDRVSERHAFSSVLKRISAFQVIAFVAMETLERQAAGAPLAGLLHHGLLPVGVAIQVVVAAAGSSVVRLLLRAAERAAEILAAPSPVPRARAFAVAPPASPLLGPRRVLAAAGLRGPPVA